MGNAGVWDFNTRLEKMDLAQLDASFDELFGVNVKGYLLAARAAAEALRASSGSMIFTLSNASFHAGGGGPLYVASKHAGLGLVRQLAFEFAPQVRVNAVAPGGTATALRGPASLAPTSALPHALRAQAFERMKRPTEAEQASRIRMTSCIA